MAVFSDDVEESLRPGEPGDAGCADVLRATTSRIDEVISWREV